MTLCALRILCQTQAVLAVSMFPGGGLAVNQTFPIGGSSTEYLFSLNPVTEPGASPRLVGVAAGEEGQLAWRALSTAPSSATELESMGRAAKGSSRTGVHS